MHSVILFVYECFTALSSSCHPGIWKHSLAAQATPMCCDHWLSETDTAVLCAIQHFDLVEEKELAPLSELIEQFSAGKMNSIR